MRHHPPLRWPGGGIAGTGGRLLVHPHPTLRRPGSESIPGAWPSPCIRAAGIFAVAADVDIPRWSVRQPVRGDHDAFGLGPCPPCLPQIPRLMLPGLLAALHRADQIAHAADLRRCKGTSKTRCSDAPCRLESFSFRWIGSGWPWALCQWVTSRRSSDCHTSLRLRHRNRCRRSQASHLDVDVLEADRVPPADRFTSAQVIS